VATKCWLGAMGSNALQLSLSSWARSSYADLLLSLYSTRRSIAGVQFFRLKVSAVWAISACNSQTGSGFRTVAVAREANKEALSRNLGAHRFIDSDRGRAGALNRLGGARAVLETLTSAKAMTPAMDGLPAAGSV
jgi:hypothetical protein